MKSQDVAKSQAELTRLILSRLGPHTPGLRVLIALVQSPGGGEPNWRAAFTTAGRRAVPAAAWTIARQVELQYQLAVE